MLFTAEQKSQLAKLMATENLTVEHQKIQTARFDPQNRILYLPIWQNMTGALYDLLCGHEVGHALYTPASGWHDAVVDESKGKVSTESLFYDDLIYLTWEEAKAKYLPQVGR